jgi:hypothetical protein
MEVAIPASLALASGWRSSMASRKPDLPVTFFWSLSRPYRVQLQSSFGGFGLDHAAYHNTVFNTTEHRTYHLGH